jgi:hypothetical protein
MEAKGILGIIAALVFIGVSILLFVPSPQPEISLTVAESFPQALWEFRPLDVFLQLLIILAGTFGILTLVKERR